MYYLPVFDACGIRPGVLAAAKASSSHVVSQGGVGLMDIGTTGCNNRMLIQNRLRMKVIGCHFLIF